MELKSFLRVSYEEVGEQVVVVRMGQVVPGRFQVNVRLKPVLSPGPLRLARVIFQPDFQL